MRYLYQFARIMVFCFLGELLHEVLPLPVPASIYGLILLLAALKLGVVRLDQVKEVGILEYFLFWLEVICGLFWKHNSRLRCWVSVCFSSCLYEPSSVEERWV